MSQPLRCKCLKDFFELYLIVVFLILVYVFNVSHFSIEVYLKK